MFWLPNARLPGARLATGAATGTLGVMLGEALFPGLLSPGLLTVPLNTGSVLMLLAAGVTGIWIVVLPPAGIVPGFVQVTVWPTVVQELPPLLKLAGALVPSGSVIVLVIVPVVGPVPPLVTVMGTLLGNPATKAGTG